jgi:hypothetical protein
MTASQSLCAFEFATIFNKFRNHANLVGHNKSHNLQSTSLLDLQSAIIHIQNKQKLERKTVYLNRLGPFLQALAQFEYVASFFVNGENYFGLIRVCWHSVYTLQFIPLSNTLQGTMKFLLEVGSTQFEPEVKLTRHLDRLSVRQTIGRSTRSLQEFRSTHAALQRKSKSFDDDSLPSESYGNSL